MPIIDSPPVGNAIKLSFAYLLICTLTVGLLDAKDEYNLIFIRGFAIYTIGLCIITLILGFSEDEEREREIKIKDPETFKKATLGLSLAYTSLSCLFCLGYMIYYIKNTEKFKEKYIIPYYTFLLIINAYFMYLIITYNKELLDEEN
jgi:cytochrome c biogenesis protein CcdA